MFWIEERFPKKTETFNYGSFLILFKVFFFGLSAKSVFQVWNIIDDNAQKNGFFCRDGRHHD